MRRGIFVSVGFPHTALPVFPGGTFFFFSVSFFAHMFFPPPVPRGTARHGRKNPSPQKSASERKRGRSGYKMDNVRNPDPSASAHITDVVQSADPGNRVGNLVFLSTNFFFPPTRPNRGIDRGASFFDERQSLSQTRNTTCAFWP